jgi:hypothetical protein
VTISTEALQVLDELDPYLERIAHKLHNTTWPQADADDLFQEMRLWFLEKWGDREDVLDNTPGFYSQGAAWRARQWARHFYTRQLNHKRIPWADPLPERWGDVLG